MTHRTTPCCGAIGAAVFLLTTVLQAEAAAQSTAQYLVGGPLAGIELPLYRTQHGEQPGYPGCIPALTAEGEVVSDMGKEYREWGPQGQAPERGLYGGSVEHYRAYMFKYLPIRSSFDRQSQLENLVAPNLPGVERSQIEQYAEPVYWVPRHKAPQPTGRHHKPVPVLRMKVGAPVLKLDLGELPVGLYVVRVIAAVETQQLRPFREPLYMRMKINDGVEGGVSEYRRRLGYCDEFYSVAEFYFQVHQPRRCRAELAVDQGSTVDLLVHNVSLDDALAGTMRRATKTRTTLGQSVVAEPGPGGLDEGDRLDRDRDIWRAFPPLNAQGSTINVGHGGYGSIRGVSAGAEGVSGEEIREQHGAWAPWGRATRKMQLPEGVRPEDVFLADPKLGLVYTHDDFRHLRPLPDPYPIKDDGAGLYFPATEEPAKGLAWTPIGVRVHQVYRDYYHAVGKALQRHEKKGKYDDAHDAAITLIRWAYAFPTLDIAEYLSSTVHESGPFGRDYSCRRRETIAFFLPHYPLYVKPIMFQYDRLFDFIKGNQLLAESVGRFLPWVKTPEDVIELIDVYLVQTTAKRILRYHYHTDPMDIANLAAVVGDRSVTDPWMDWLFSRTFIYPLPVAGIQDTMISGTTREGTEFVGSTYYAQGEGAARVAEALDLYLAAAGNPRFDLSDQSRYPKPVAHAYWRIENVVAGQDFLRIGDVCGPDKVPGHTLRKLDFARPAWRWTRDPKFAFILEHYLGRKAMSDREWAEVEEASGQCPRAPWLENRSRVLPMWAGVLEAGTEHDDPRFRRAAYLRVGYGMGHHHDDTFDLQIVAHGLPMTIDGGQRPGYASPGDRTTRIHNTVEVDGRGHRDHSWVTALADHRGARYLAATAVPPPGATLFRRQIALIDVDEPSTPRKLTPEQQKPFAVLPKAGGTANSYVFDTFRVAGGTRHTYCFHGPLHDDFQWNAQDIAAPTGGSDAADYLSMFKIKPELSFVGTALESFVATWRMALQVPGPGAGEKEMLGKSYDPSSPRKFTRLHLLGAGGSRALRSQAVCRRWKYDYTNVMVQRKADAGRELESVFAAIVEPYVGEAFIAAVRRLDMDEAVAVEVKTTNGHRDLCFSDGRPDQTRTIAEPKVRVSGEFAFVSTDQQGLRLATMAGGKLLDTPQIRIEAGAAVRRAKVIRADYLKKRLWIDQRWPRPAKPMIFEIGLPDTEHRTTYTAVDVEPADGGSAITVQRGADVYRSEILSVTPDRVVKCTLKPLSSCVRGNQKGWVASNEAMTRFWRAESLGDGAFRLSGEPVSLEAFGDERVLRLWEYGSGDTVWQRTSVSCRRSAPGLFALEADTAVKVSLPGRSAQISSDGKSWRPVTDKVADGWVSVSIPEDRLAGQTVTIRLSPQ